MARFLRTDTNSSGGHSVLRGPEPPIVFPPFRASAIRVTLVDQTDDAQILANQRRPKSFYQRPIVKAPLPPQGGVLIQYVQPPRMARWVGSRLRPPQVVTPPAAPFVARPIRVTLVDQTDDAQILANQRRTLSRLRGPLYIVEPVIANIVPGGPGVRLAASFRGTPKSRLEPPVVIGAAAAPFVASPIRVELTRIRPQRTQYRLGPPVAVYVIPLNFGPGVRLTPPSRGLPKSKLSPPTVTTPPSAPFVATPIRVELTRIRPPRTIVRLLEVIYEARVYDRIRGSLTPPLDRVPRTISRLPEVIYEARVYDGIAGSLTPPLDRVPRTISDLRPPTVVRAFRISVTAVHLAPSSRGKPRPFFTVPVVVDAQTPPLGGTLIQYVQPPRQARGAKSRLDPPVVVTPAATTIFFGPKVTLADQLLRITRKRPRSRLLPVPAAFRPFAPVKVELAASKRGTPKSRLDAPVVIGGAIAFGGPRVRLTNPRDRIAPVESRLRPPTVIDVRPQTRYLRVHLAYSRRGTPKSKLRRPTDLIDAQDLGRVRITLTRIRPRRTDASVFKPVVINQGLGQQGGIGVQLARSFRGTPKSRLEPPTVTTAVTVTFAGPRVELARIRPVRTLARLLAVPAAFRPVGFVNVTLAPSFRGKPKSRLRRPVDLVDRDDLGYVRVRLAYQSRRPGRIELRAPVVIDLRPQVYYVAVALVRIRPVRTIVRLEPPTDLVDRQDLGRVRVTLAPQKRGTPKSRLEPPTVVDLRPQVYYVAVELAPSFRGIPKSILRRPTDLVDRQDLGSVSVTLVRIRPVPTRPRLEPPVVIDLRPQVYRVRVELAYSLRGKPKSILRRPTDLVDRQDVGVVRVHLAYSSRGKPESRLYAPAVVGPVLARRIATSLARIVPPAVHSVLRKPAVIDLRPQTYYVSLTLAPSRFPKPKSTLRFTQITFRPQFDSTLLLHLAYQSRGKPKSKLRPPAVVGAGIYFRGVLVRLAPSRFPKPKSRLSLTKIVQTFRIPVVSIYLAPATRPKPKSVLRTPVAVSAKVVYPPLEVHLAYSVRGRAKSILRKPTLIDLRPQTYFVAITLAPQKRGVPKSFLRKPTDLVDRQDLGFVRVHLAPSFRGKPKSKLRPPTVVARFQARPVDITLAPQRRGAPKSFLRPPTVLVQPVVHEAVVHFARIRPPRTIWFLRPPAVVSAPPAVIYYGPRVTLVRIRPVRTQSMLTPRIEPTICYGIVCGGDYGRQVVCGDDSAAVVSGSDQAGAKVSGSDDARKGHRGDRPRRYCPGGDERREGC